MAGEQADQLLRRIDSALARIEVACARIGPIDSSGAGDADLLGRHQALRQAALTALTQIDELIGERTVAQVAPQ